MVFKLISGYWRRKWDRDSETRQALGWRNILKAFLFLRPSLFYGAYVRLDESEKPYASLNIKVFWLLWICLIVLLVFAGNLMFHWSQEPMERLMERSAELGPFWQTIVIGLTLAVVAVIYLPMMLPAFFLMMFLWMSLRQGVMKWLSILLRGPVPMRDCGVLSFFSGLPLVGVLFIPFLDPPGGRALLLVLEVWSLFLLISGVGAWIASRWKRLGLFFFMAVFDTLVVYGISKILWWGANLSN